MFERFGDLPLHVLVIHVAVVVLPVAALTAIVFALVPRWRWLLRWPVLLLGLGSLVLAYVAKESGDAFVAAVPTLEQAVREHEARGDLLFWYCLIFAAVAVAAFLLLGGTSPLASGKGAKTTKSRPLELLTSAAVVVIGVLVIWQTIRTGDAGAKAVWDGQLPK
jgi:glucan phosphoethanolaminetransferase (alkaline phosphatase superfamily)